MTKKKEIIQGINEAKMYLRVKISDNVKVIITKEETKYITYNNMKDTIKRREGVEDISFRVKRQ